MKIQKYIVLIFLLLFGFTAAFAQNLRTYSGSISDEKGDPVVGAVVSANEGSTQVATGDEGQFSIDAKVGSYLLIEADGYQSVMVEAAASSKVVMDQVVFISQGADRLQVPFTTVEKRKTTGSITQINVDEELKFDQRRSVGAALNGKVSGLFGTTNIWGRGGAVLVVDGIVRTITDLSLDEIESITVLKDPVSRSMYGAQADQGVILVTTKRGKANKRVLDFRAETGFSEAKALPSFLGASDYMSAYNQAQINDGGVPKYSPEMISSAGSSPLYPDEDFYSNKYLQNSTRYFGFNATASGGNQNTRYFVNMDWSNHSGWFKLADEDVTNKMNLRGNVDFNISKNLSMKLDGVATFVFNKTSNIQDFWGRAATVVPNAYPVSWDPSLITDESVREEIMAKAELVDGQLLGGNKTYTNNIYGDFLKGGNRNEMYRILQFNSGFDYDLNEITPGLKASAYFTFDFFNVLNTFQDSKYAVYNPVMGSDGSIGVEVIGEDKSVSNYSTENQSAYFQRRIGLYGTLSYNKKIGDHEVSAVAVAYRDQMSMRGMQQDIKNLHFGMSANYVYKGKYLADVAAVAVGTQKLPSGENYAFTPAVGLGWILSEEGFMADNKTFDFLKLRANYGVLKNDNWDNYFLYETSYQTGSNFYYDGRNFSNEELNYVTRASEIAWQKREEFTFGFDAAMLDKRIWLEATFFNTKETDLITLMDNAYPSLIGANPFYSNYNANERRGFDLGVKYSRTSGDWNYTIGSNVVYSLPKILKIEEPAYDERHSYLSKKGTRTDAIWGLETDGLYGESDFTTIDYANQIFELNENLPTSSFANVQPGDIKYVDQDGNGVIDNEDLIEMASGSDRTQYSIYLKLKYKKIELFAMGIGRTGNHNQRSGDYHRFYGELKYPEFAKEVYGPSNKDVNASYPRLSSTRSNHNFRSSTYWLYENNWFEIPTLQLSYHLIENNYQGVLRDARIYLMANNVATFSDVKEITEVNVGSAPQTRTFSIGFVAKF